MSKARGSDVHSHQPYQPRVFLHIWVAGRGQWCGHQFFFFFYNLPSLCTRLPRRRLTMCVKTATTTTKNRRNQTTRSPTNIQYICNMQFYGPARNYYYYYFVYLVWHIIIVCAHRIDRDTCLTNQTKKKKHIYYLLFCEVANRTVATSLSTPLCAIRCMYFNTVLLDGFVFVFWFFRYISFQWKGTKKYQRNVKNLAHGQRNETNKKER